MADRLIPLCTRPVVTVDGHQGHYKKTTGEFVICCKRHESPVLPDRLGQHSLECKARYHGYIPTLADAAANKGCPACQREVQTHLAR